MPKLSRVRVATLMLSCELRPTTPYCGKRAGRLPGCVALGAEGQGWMRLVACRYRYGTQGGGRRLQESTAIFSGKVTILFFFSSRAALGSLYAASRCEYPIDRTKALARTSKRCLLLVASWPRVLVVGWEIPRGRLGDGQDNDGLLPCKVPPVSICDCASVVRVCPYPGIARCLSLVLHACRAV